MTIAVLDQDQHVGRDANDTTWLVVRYADDWQKATLDDLYRDPLGQVVELAPLSPPDDNDGPLCVPPDGSGPPPADPTAIWLPLAPVADVNGDLYKSDRRNDLVLRQRACDADFTPLPCFGGSGFETGRLSGPTGLALDERGFLFVADSCNHRVQVVRPEDGSVVVVLGGVDSYGRPLAGVDGGLMTEPVDVALDPCHCHVYVADRTGGRVHVFNQRFQWVLSFEPQPVSPRPAGQHALPVGIAVDSDGSLLIADARWPRLLRASAAGEVLGEVVLRDPVNPHFAGLAAEQRFALEGTALIGPLDGRAYDTAWHQVVIDADLPAGTAIEVQTYARNDTTVNVAEIPWAPARPVRVAAPETPDEDGYRRLILSDTLRWERANHGPYQRARPTLASFTGAGPGAGGASVVLPAAALPLVRSGDGLVFTAGAVKAAVTLGPPPPRSASLFLEGTGALYAAGATLALRERGGEALPGGSRVIYAMGAGEQIDLSAAAADGTPQDVLVPHGAAAFLREDDVLDLGDGVNSCTLVVDDIRFADTAVAFSPAVATDFSTSVLTLDLTPGRLVAADLDGFEAPPPPGEPIHVVDVTGANMVTTTVILAEPELGALWVDPAPLAGAVTFQSWATFTTDPAAATDRGQFLWVMLRLIGRTDHPASTFAVDTPAVRALRLLYKRPSYLAFLPATYARRDDRNDPSGALFLERFLTLFEGRFTRAEALYESMSRLLNPDAAPPEWLGWLASWLGLVFDPSWSLDKRRKLVLSAVDLYRRRGTPAGIADWIEIYTGARPALIEGFQTRARPGTVLDGSSALGCLQLLDECCAATACGPTGDGLANHFVVYIYLDDPCDRDLVEGVVRSILETNKPAHTSYDLQVVLPEARVALQATIGVDFVLGDGAPAAPSILGQGVPPAGGPWQPVVGIDLYLGEDPARRAVAAPGLGGYGLTLDDDLRLR